MSAEINTNGVKMDTTDLEKLLTTEKKQLDAEYKQLIAEIDVKEENLHQIQKDLSHDRKRLREVQGRLEHVNGLLGDTGESVKEASAGLPVDTHDVLSLAEDILNGLGGKELHFGEIARQVMERGGVLNGVDPANTLNARMTRDPRFVRPTRRGYYALRAHHPDAAHVGARKGSVNR